MAVAMEELTAFLNSPVPRDIPRNIRKERLKGSLGVGLYVFGGFFFAFGSIFLFIFFPWNIHNELRLDMGKPSKAEGVITRIDKTNMSVGGSKHSKGTPVYEIFFRFTGPGGNEINSSCYHTGSYGRSGKRVSIEYVDSSPQISRIENCRLNKAGYFGSFVALFPLVGAGLMFGLWRSRSSAVNVLQNGSFCVGKVTAVDSTNVKVNNQRRYKISVEYDLDGSSGSSTYNAYGEDVTLAQQRMQSGDLVAILVNPNNTKQAFIADTLLDEGVSVGSSGSSKDMEYMPDDDDEFGSL